MELQLQLPSVWSFVLLFSGRGRQRLIVLKEVKQCLRGRLRLPVDKQDSHVESTRAALCLNDDITLSVSHHPRESEECFLLPRRVGAGSVISLLFLPQSS